MAIAPVVIEFLAKGMPAVSQAFKSIHDSAIRAEKAQTVAAEQGAAKRVNTAKQEAQQKIAAMKKADQAQRQAWAAGDREASRFAAKQTALEKETVQGKIAAWKTADRYAAQARASGQREAERVAREEVRREERTAREKARVQRQMNRDRGRLVESVVSSGARAVMTGMGRAGNVAMGLANTAAQLGGGFSIADAVEKRLGAQRLAANIASSTLTEKVSADDILKAAKPVSIGTGMDLESVVSGVDSFRKISGQTTRGMGMLPQLAKISTVFGANLDEIAKNAGGMAMAGNLSDDDIMKMVRVQAYQGSVGAVELPDFAKYGQRITTAARDFAGDRTANIGAVGAAAQIAMQSGSATTPSEATLAALRFTEDLAKKHKKLEKLGITTVKDGRLRPLADITAEMMAKTHGDVDKITDLGIGERGNKFLKGVGAIYRDEGQAGLDRDWSKFTGQIVDPKTGKKREALTDDDMNKRFMERMSGSDKALETAFNELRVTAGEQLLPVFVEMVPTLKQLIPELVNLAKVGIPAFTSLIGTVADFVEANKGLIESLAANPVGSLIAFELSKSFLSAGLPALLRALFAGAFGNIGGVGAAGGAAKAIGASVGATTAGGLLAAAGVGIAAGTAVNNVIYSAGTKYADGEMNADDLAARVRAWGQGNKERGLSPEYATQQLEAAKLRLGKTGTLDQMGNIIASPFLDSASKNYGQYKADQALVDHKDLKRAIQEAAAAGVREGVAAGVKALPQNNSGPAGAGRSQPISQR